MNHILLSITLRQLEYATATAHHGGMTAAAHALNVSQPALSAAIARLEETLGRPLFLRRSGGMEPTAFGRQWLQRAAAQLEAIDRLVRGSEAGAAPVRLAIFEDLAPALLAPLLARLQALPDISVEPRILGFEVLAQELAAGRVDLALTWDLGLPPGLRLQALAQVAPHAVLAPDHPLAACTGLRLADLQDQPLILTDQGLSLGHMRALFASRGLRLTLAHRAATIELMRSFAANGLGVGLSYARPAPSISTDGRALVTVPVIDAGQEPLVLAALSETDAAPAAERLAALMPVILASELARL